MPKSIWVSPAKIREREQAKYWDWIDGQLREKHIGPEDVARQMGCTARTFFNYRRCRKLPFDKMAKLLGVIEASPEDIVKVVRAWQ